MEENCEPATEEGQARLKVDVGATKVEAMDVVIQEPESTEPEDQT